MEDGIPTKAENIIVSMYNILESTEITIRNKIQTLAPDLNTKQMMILIMVCDNLKMTRYIVRYILNLK